MEGSVRKCLALVLKFVLFLYFFLVCLLKQKRTNNKRIKGKLAHISTQCIAWPYKVIIMQMALDYC